MPRKTKSPKLLKLPDPNGKTKGARTVTNSGLNNEQLTVRRETAFALRVDEGLSYREIVERMKGAYGDKYNKDSALADCKIIAKMKFEGMIERDEMVKFESEAHYDRLLTLWSPLLQPLIEGKLIVGDTKYDRKGQAYDITMPNFEAAKTATEAILKTLSQREKLHGWQQPLAKSGEPSPKDLELTGAAMFEFMRGLVNKSAQVIDVPVERIEDTKHETN